VSDLGALSAWTQQQGLAGAVNLEAVLAAPEGRQDATLKADASGIVGDFGRLQQATATAAVRDARGTPALDADVTVTGFARPDLEVRQATLAAEGPLDRLGLKLAATGTQASQPLDVRAEAEVSALGERKSVLLSAFAGKLAGQDIALAAPARLTLDQGVLDLDQLDLKVGPAQVQGSLRYGAGSARGEIRLASLPLGLLEPFGAPPLQGSARGTLRLDGTTQAPQATLDLTVADLQPKGAGKGTPDADLRLTARTDGDGLDAALTAAGLGERPLEARAALPLRLSLEPFAFELPSSAPLSGSLKGGIDLKRVAALAALDGQIVTGTLNADLRLAGTLARPGLDGGVSLRGGRVDDLTTGASFRDVTLLAEASGRRVELTDLSAADRYGGRIAGRGAFALDDALRPDFDLAVNLARARVLDGDLGAAVVSGDASVEGGAAAAAVGARLRIDEADIRIPNAGGATVPPQLDVVEKGAAADVAPGAGPDPYPVRLDVVVDAPGRLFVRGRGLESEWGGEVRATGTVQEPVVTGEIRYRRGSLELLGKRFDIRRGVVTFAGGSPPVPVLDLEAAVAADDAQALVRLRGPATDPDLELSSEPRLPQDEILARVLFGRTKDRITPVQGLRLAAAVRELQGSGGLGDVVDGLRRAAGLDTLDLQSGATAAESSASVGKYVNDRVFLQLQRGVQPGTGKARVEVELTPNLSVGTDVTERSQTGVDLQWRYDY
jgi:translocation and assembly module TamB